KTTAGETDHLLDEVDDPFYAADFRHWQVVQPDRKRLEELGANVLAVEKYRPHVELERAVMGIRLSPEVVGVQFHPEADPEGMLKHFSQSKRRQHIIEHHGEEKYDRIIHRLEDPNYLDRTHRAVLPSFLESAVEARVAESTQPAAS
ncbi:MAG: GMP synthase, partial [Rhodothermia bacterium]|nr:GMP synthase [Rhodothermia bacterium]